MPNINSLKEQIETYKSMAIRFSTIEDDIKNKIKGIIVDLKNEGIDPKTIKDRISVLEKEIEDDYARLEKDSAQLKEKINAI